MKPANLEALKEKIIRPDFDKHLVPLMLYRGSNTVEAFGRMTRAWNFAVTMMESECVNFSEAARLSANPDFAHLCGPRRPLLYGNFASLFGRLQDHPRITDNIPGLTEYVRSVRGPKHRLTPISIYTNDPTRKNRDFAPWRINDYDPETKAAKEAEFVARIAQRVTAHFEKEMKRLSRALERDRAREKREAELRERIADAIDKKLVSVEAKQRARAIAQQAASAAKARDKLLAQESAAKLFYPYLIHKPANGDNERALLFEVNEAVPKHLPDYLRADICQDLIVAILSGDIARENLKENVRGFVSKVFKMHPLKYGPLSLDAPVLVGGDDTRTLGELLAPDERYW